MNFNAKMLGTAFSLPLLIGFSLHAVKGAGNKRTASEFLHMCTLSNHFQTKIWNIFHTLESLLESLSNQ